MKVTQNLKLPQYTEDDVFDLTVINEAHNKIDTAYKEIDTTYKEIANLREEIPKVNADAEIIDARGGQTTLGDKIRNIDSQLDTNVRELNEKIDEVATTGTTEEAVQNKVQVMAEAGLIQAYTLGDKTIANSKLKDDFDYVGAVTNGSINDITKSGVYRIGNTVTDNPLGLVTSVLIHKTVGGLFYQKIYNQSNSQQQYERVYSTSSSNDMTKWKNTSNILEDNSVSTTNIIDNSITNTKLADNFNYCGLATTGSVNDCLKDGVYYLGNGVTDNPLGAKPSILINKNIENRIYQKIFTHNNAINKFERVCLKSELTDMSKWTKLEIPQQTPLPLEGKKIVHFGDSILQYGNYYTKIAEKTGAITYNCGIGGGTLCVHPNNLYAPLSLVNLVDNIVTNDFTSAIQGAENLYNSNKDDKRQIINLLSTIDFNEIDIITIAYGTNEMGNKVRLGEANSEDTTKFNGGINYVLKKLMTTFPHIKIYFFTPIYRTKLGTTGYEDGLTYTVADTGLKLLDYVDTVIARGQERGCPVYDAFRNMGINFYNSTLYLGDGLHPNTVGDDRLADEYSKFLISN